MLKTNNEETILLNDSEALVISFTEDTYTRLEMIEEIDHDECLEPTMFRLYQIDLEQVQNAKDQWFGKELSRVAKFVGYDESTLKDLLSSIYPQDRALAYSAIANYHGPLNFDQYPFDLSSKELNERWGR